MPHLIIAVISLFNKIKFLIQLSAGLNSTSSAFIWQSWDSQTILHKTKKKENKKGPDIFIQLCRKKQKLAVCYV